MVKARDCDETKSPSLTREQRPERLRAVSALAPLVAVSFAEAWVAAHLGPSPGPSLWRTASSTVFGGVFVFGLALVWVGLALLVVVLATSRQFARQARTGALACFVAGGLALAGPCWLEALVLYRDFGPPLGTKAALALTLGGALSMCAIVLPIMALDVPRSSSPHPGCRQRIVGLAGIVAAWAITAWVFVSPPLHSAASRRMSDARLADASTSAESHLAQAGGLNGQLRYALAPGSNGVFTPQFDRYSLARHAGATLVMCDHARSEDALATARAAVVFILGHEREGGHLTRSIDARSYDLTDQALPLVAMLRCRERFGPWARLDAAIARSAGALLEHQREDGSFSAHLHRPARTAPASGALLNLAHRAPFVDGQALLALAELGLGDLDDGDERYARAFSIGVSRVVEHDMTRLPDGFITLEANWHCAAAERITHPDAHALQKLVSPETRHAYEDLCLRYVSQRVFAARYGIGLGPSSGKRMHVGGTAVLAESLADAIAILDHRADVTTADRRALRDALESMTASVVETQWRDLEPDNDLEGGFPTRTNDPYTRIDTTQHAWHAIARTADVRRSSAR